jgi:hypothetical protein
MIRFPLLVSSPKNKFSRRIGVVPFVFALASVMGFSMIDARPVSAQDQSAIDRLVQLNKKAMDDYDTADFDLARKSLLDAEKLGKRAGLEGHPVMARTYIHLGALYWMGFKDTNRAQHYFGKALDIQADIRLDKTLTSPSLKQLFAKVQEQRAAGGAPAAGGSTDAESAAEALFPKKRGQAQQPAQGPAAPPPADTADDEASSAPGKRNKSIRKATVSADAPDPDLPTTVVALDCPYPDETPLGKKVVLRCAAAEKLGVAKVLLFYKGFEMTAFEGIDMARSPKGWWQASLPKKRVDGKSLQFYFEGLNAADRPVVSNGRAESPNVMLIVEGGGASAAAAMPGSRNEENPLDENGQETPRIVLGRFDSSRVGLDTRYGNRHYWISLGVGTGFVYAINGVPEASVASLAVQRSNQTVTGFGWAGLGQLVPEIGLQLTPDWAVSIESRHQWIPQDKKVAGYTAAGAHSILLKGLRFTKQNRFRIFYGAALGGGEGIRMNIFTDPSPTASSFKDTIRVGGLLFGGTAGAYYEISHALSWIVEINALFGVPKAGVGFDFNTALQFNIGDTSGRAEKEAKRREDSVSTSVDDEDPK